MHSRKQHLLNAGKIQAITRGRISGENLKWLEGEYNNGTRFTDWSPEDGVTKPVAKNPKPRSVVQESKNTEEYTGISDYVEFYPEDDYRAYQMVDGKKHYRSMREACRNCMRSLTQCPCATIGRDALIVSEDGRKSVSVLIERKP